MAKKVLLCAVNFSLAALISSACGAAIASQTDQAQASQPGQTPASQSSQSTVSQPGQNPASQPDQAPADTHQPLSQAELWVQKRSLPDFVLPPDDGEKKKHAPVRSFIKHVAKGAAKELGTSAEDMGKDMVLVFSVQDIDPYNKSKPPKNRDAIVLKFTMVDGSTAYLRRFPDGSFAVEDGFADNTVLVRDGDSPTDFIVKYPNGARGWIRFQGRNTVVVHRPDKTLTTFTKTSDGGYTIKNDKLGYMGSARPDSTGVHYEVGDW